MGNIHNPFYRKPMQPNYCRRCSNHDYMRPSKYMITLLKSDATSALSKVVGNPAAMQNNENFPHVELLESGKFIEEALLNWLKKYTQIRIANKVIMPDHVHL